MNARLGIAIASSLTLLSSAAFGQRQVEWTEGPGELGLGYPVPMAAASVLPFDGFREYASLHTRHQDLALISAWVHGQIVGQTTAERDIWAYRIGDADLLTVEGLPEPAMMTEGGIHAREWQSPEVVTGIMETLVGNADDNHLYRYLLDNANVVLLPVQNIDGFQQTQRFPNLSYLGSDLGSPNSSPRDGRMRRKHMLGVDEVFDTTDDHLLGVDLNRNNPPFWATNSARSSGDARSIVHHGLGAHSEPETQAMVATAGLGPIDRLRMYTDVHSFSQVSFSIVTDNTRRNGIQNQLLAVFNQFHAALPGGKSYPDVRDSDPNSGIGSTDEYFGATYQIPSWTLEIEPSGRPSNPANDVHPSLPGCGADYGGFASNCHDGFVLPESEIRRVRDELAQTFAVSYYHQAGPPALAQLRLFDQQTGAVVVDLEWDTIDSSERRLHQNILQPVQAGRPYSLWLAANKPMRWRNQVGAIVPLPGQSGGLLNGQVEHSDADGILNAGSGGFTWLNFSDLEPGRSQPGYRRYRDDAFTRPIQFNAADFSAETSVTLRASMFDMVGLRLDSDPATPVDWADGHWVGYENADGVEGDSGGSDLQFAYPVTAEELGDPFVIEPGTSAAWFDPDRAGEGFLVEVIAADRAIVYWFTYDDAGNPDWLIGDGKIVANRIVIREFLEPTIGSPFGDFDPDQIVLTGAGSAELLFGECSDGSASFARDGKPKLRHQLARLTNLSGLGCGQQNAPSADDAISGSWFDPDNAGQGFVVQRIAADRAIVYWFTYDADGDPWWIFGDGTITGDTLQINDALTFSGPSFGQDFDAAAVEQSSWGQLTLSFACNSAEATYASSLNDFGSGTMALTRLTQISGLACSD